MDKDLKIPTSAMHPPSHIFVVFYSSDTISHSPSKSANQGHILAHPTVQPFHKQWAPPLGNSANANGQVPKRRSRHCEQGQPYRTARFHHTEYLGQHRTHPPDKEQRVGRTKTVTVRKEGCVSAPGGFVKPAQHRHKKCMCVHRKVCVCVCAHASSLDDGRGVSRAQQSSVDGHTHARTVWAPGASL